MPPFTRIRRLNKRIDKILFLARDELSILLHRIKTRGEGIVQPQQLSEDIESVKIGFASDSTSAYEDFKGLFLDLIQEAIGLPHGVVFVLSPNRGFWEYVLVNYDTLEVAELAYSAYSDFRNRNQNASKGVAVVPAVVLQGVAVVPAVMLHTHGVGSSTTKRSKQKKIQKH
ncbi:sucrose synthase [Ranunculus cassubicifolius]